MGTWKRERETDGEQSGCESPFIAGARHTPAIGELPSLVSMAACYLRGMFTGADMICLAGSSAGMWASISSDRLRQDENPDSTCFLREAFKLTFPVLRVSTAMRSDGLRGDGTDLLGLFRELKLDRT